MRLHLLWSWSPRCWRLSVERPAGVWSLIYIWWAQLGPLEVRRWAS